MEWIIFADIDGYERVESWNDSCDRAILLLKSSERRPIISERNLLLNMKACCVVEFSKW